LFTRRIWLPAFSKAIFEDRSIDFKVIYSSFLFWLLKFNCLFFIRLFFIRLFFIRIFFIIIFFIRLFSLLVWFFSLSLWRFTLSSFFLFRLFNPLLLFFSLLICCCRFFLNFLSICSLIESFLSFLLGAPLVLTVLGDSNIYICRSCSRGSEQVVFVVCMVLISLLITILGEELRWTLVLRWWADNCGGCRLGSLWRRFWIWFLDSGIFPFTSSHSLTVPYRRSNNLNATSIF